MVADIKYQTAIREFESKATLPLSIPIPVSPYTYEMFSYPEHSDDIDELLIRNVDYTHIMTKL